MTRPPLPEMPGVEHRDVDLATGVRAHVALAGPPDAPRVLALHGWPQHWYCWRDVLRMLDGSVRVACPDLRGLGWSGWPRDGDFGKDGLAADAIAVLDALGWERALLVGHDWGALAGYLAALRAPERLTGLLALGVGHPWPSPARVALDAWRFAYQLPLAAPGLGAALVRDGRFVAAILRAGWGEDGAYPAEDVAPYVDVLRHDGAARASERYYRTFLLRDAPALPGRVRGRRLTVPTRLLQGRRDPLGVALAEGLERHGDDARVELVDRAGHWLPQERPRLVAERVRALVA